jgi:hypothetical protein
MDEIIIIECVIRNQTNELRMLLDSKADPNIKTPRSKLTPLHYAALHSKNECIQLLLQYGADIHARNTFGETPLFNSVESYILSTSQLLIETKSDVNAICTDGKSILDYAAHCGDYQRAVSLVQMLLDAGAKPTPQNINHPKIVVSYRRLRRTKQALITFIGIMKKRLGVCKDMRTLMGTLVYSTRYQEVWNMREIKRMK